VDSDDEDVVRSQPTFIVDSDDEDVARMHIDHLAGDSDDGWHFMDKKGRKLFPGGPLDPPHHSRSATQHPEHAAQNVTRPRLLVDSDDDDTYDNGSGQWHIQDRKGNQYYPGGPSCAGNNCGSTIFTAADDMSPRHSIITTQAIQEAFHVIDTHSPYFQCAVPEWVNPPGPDPLVLNSPVFIRAWQSFRFYYQKMWETLLPSDPQNHAQQVHGLNQAIHKLDQAYSRALGH
jgi:hypothetical protein